MCAAVPHTCTYCPTCIIIIIVAVISIAPYLTDKGEHTSLYKVSDKTFIKISKMINYLVMITHTHACTHLYHLHGVPLHVLKLMNLI